MRAFTGLRRHGHILLFLTTAFALCLLAYGRSIMQGFAPIDDSYLIFNNPYVHGITWENIKGIFSTFDPELYIPLTLFSFQVNYLMSGLDPWTFHMTNIFLHALNATLVFVILEILSKERLASALAALIFAVHPLHTEAVVWLAGRKDLLSTFFFLLTFFTYLIYREKRGWMMYVVSVFCFVLALLSKVSVATLPAVLVLYDLLIEGRNWKQRSFFADKVPYVFLSVIFLLVAMLGKERVLSSATLTETILMAAKSTVFYIQKFLWPQGLHPLHSYEEVIRLTSIDFWPHVLLVLTIIGIGTRYLKRIPWLSFAIFFTLITLAPSFFNFRKGELDALAVERYAYIPSIGFLMLLLIPLAYVAKRATESDGKRLTGIVGLLLFFGLLMTLSFRQSKIWDTAETLFARGVAIYPESAIARTEYARTLRQMDLDEEAFAVLKDGLAYRDHWMLHREAGLIYAKTGDIASAREQFNLARMMAPQNPEPLFNLASLEYQLKNSISAKPLLEEAIQLDPSYVVARIMLGDILVAEKDFEAAEKQFLAAIEWYPHSLEAHVSLANLYLTQRRTEEARQLLKQALTIDPMNGKARSLLTDLPGAEEPEPHSQ